MWTGELRVSAQEKEVGRGAGVITQSIKDLPGMQAWEPELIPEPRGLDPLTGEAETGRSLEFSG